MWRTVPPNSVTMLRALAEARYKLYFKTGMCLKSTVFIGTTFLSVIQSDRVPAKAISFVIKISGPELQLAYRLVK